MRGIFSFFLPCAIALVTAWPVWASDGAITVDHIKDGVPLLLIVMTGGIAWGVERQSRKDLERRHGEATREIRERMAALETRNSVQEKETSERTAHLNVDIVALRARVDATVEALARLDVKQERDREDIMRALEKLSDNVQGMRDDFHSAFASASDKRS